MVFELALVFVLDLHGIIGQMDTGVVQVCQRVFCAISAHITMLEVVGTQCAVQVGHQALDSDVKLTVLDQEWLFNLLLHNPLFAFFGALSDFIHRPTDLDAYALVVIGRFDNPYLFWGSSCILVIIIVFIFFWIVVLYVECEG